MSNHYIKVKCPTCKAELEMPEFVPGSEDAERNQLAIDLEHRHFESKRFCLFCERDVLFQIPVNPAQTRDDLLQRSLAPAPTPFLVTQDKTQDFSYETPRSITAKLPDTSGLLLRAARRAAQKGNIDKAQALVDQWRVAQPEPNSHLAFALAAAHKATLLKVSRRNEGALLTHLIRELDEHLKELEGADHFNLERLRDRIAG